MVQLFVDASQQAYGAAVYIRCEYHKNAITSRLVAAKSKVALLTPMTIPRLDLMGPTLNTVLADGPRSTNVECDFLFRQYRCSMMDLRAWQRLPTVRSQPNW